MKIPPKSLYTLKDPNQSRPSTQSDEIGEINEEFESIRLDSVFDTVQEEKAVWPYNVEKTLEKLDYEDRKWLLFQLVLCNPIFLEEVLLGFPMSLVVDDVVNDLQLADGAVDGTRDRIGRKGMNDEEGEDNCPIDDIDEEDDTALNMTDLSLGAEGVKDDVIEERGKCRNGKQKANNITVEEEASHWASKNSQIGELLPILVPESEWLLTYCQIDAIPSSTRDEFLLNLFLMSPTHSSKLETFYASLESGRMNHGSYETYSDVEKWKGRFEKVNEGRRVIARARMGVDYGSVGYWEEFGEGREGVWDVALCELGGWLMRDLPGPNGLCAGKSPEVDDSIGKQTDVRADLEGIKGRYEYAQERSSKVDESEYYHPSQWYIAQDHIKMMAFIIQTKTLSLTRQITRPDSASVSWPGRYRYKALTINDMVKVSVLLTRSPIPLRKLLHNEIRSISAEIVVLFDELDGAECEWVRVDDDLAWELECVQRGLDDVGYGYLWEGVMAAWYEKSV